MTTRKRNLLVGAVAVVVVIGGWAAARLTGPDLAVPTADVKRGEFMDYLQIRGEVKAAKSTLITAPMRSGDLQIIRILKNGSMVKRGDVVVEFDTTSLLQTLEQRQTDLKAADAEIERSRAQYRMDREQRVTDKLRANYDVERARLDVSKQEILSEIEGEKTKLTLADNQQKLVETDERVKSSEVAAQADLGSRRQRRNKELFDLQTAQRQIASMVVRAPLDGIVTLSPNSRSRFFGSSSPDFKEGDRAWPGATIAEIPDLSSILINTRVDETDRGRLKKDQVALVRIDAIPDKEFKASVTEIGAVAKPDFSSWPITKNFDLVVTINDTDQRLRPGMSANARIIIERVPDAILIPSEAVFERNGKTIVYVVHGNKAEERVITIGRRGSGQVIVKSGVTPGERVALKDPNEEKAEK